ncbi:MAG: hypothetical protein HOV67_27730, partial [Kribbellaceae bacterium]|nr:hypothetical protein [Kribbellaceae bacterium]
MLRSRLAVPALAGVLALSGSLLAAHSAVADDKDSRTATSQALADDPPAGVQPVGGGTGWNLKWWDEFNGSAVDWGTKW